MKDKNEFPGGVCGEPFCTPAFSGVHSFTPITSRYRLISVLGSRREALLDGLSVHMACAVQCIRHLIKLGDKLIIHIHHILVTIYWTVRLVVFPYLLDPGTGSRSVQRMGETNMSKTARSNDSKNPLLTRIEVFKTKANQTESPKKQTETFISCTYNHGQTHEGVVKKVLDIAGFPEMC